MMEDSKKNGGNSGSKTPRTNLTPINEGVFTFLGQLTIGLWLNKKK
jgi:hypothetical protein